MAKDPAMLWYWGDWHSGTVLMSRFLKGCYIDILHAQFNNGRLSLEEIKTCLGSDFGTSWPTLQKKFKQDEKGLFFNERLEHEKNRRQKFSESRRENVNKRYDKTTYEPTYVEHMNLHMENENRNENENEIKDKGVQGEKELTALEIGNTIEFIHRVQQVKLSQDEVKNYWQAFLLNGQEAAYYTREKKIQHFRYWLKKQHGNKSVTNSNGAHKSARDRQADATNSLVEKLKRVTGTG